MVTACDYSSSLDSSAALADLCSDEAFIETPRKPMGERSTLLDLFFAAAAFERLIGGKLVLTSSGMDSSLVSSAPANIYEFCTLLGLICF